jgi:hypothetical protein
MSRYSSDNVKTSYQDPVAFSNLRCRFELDASKLCYMPNMRLLDIGCNAQGELEYNRGLGALALIKNIRLMDARTELSSLRTVAPYMFFKNSNHSNSENKSQKSWMRRNHLGLELEASSNKLGHLYSPGNVNTVALGSETAILDLTRCFPILNKVSCLPTSIFKNLSIEIEFETNIARQIYTTTAAANTCEIIRPVLAVDFIDNPSIVGPMTSQLVSDGARWLEVEHDNYVIPAVNTAGYGAADSINVVNNNNSLGFIGKLVERLLITKQIGDFSQEVLSGEVLGYSALASSQSLLNETVQVRLNGRNTMPGAKGISGANAKLAQMADTFGEFSMNPASNQYKWNVAGELFKTGNGYGGGQQDWFGMMLGARVQNLQIEIARDTQNDTQPRDPTNSQLNVNLYAEVHKQISFANGVYKIVYL